MENKLLKTTELGHHATALTHLFLLVEGSPSKDLIIRFNQNVNILFKSYYILRDSPESSNQFSPFVDWYLDNFFLIREHFELVQKNFSQKYNKSLPLCTEGHIKNSPRIYNIIYEYLSHTNGQFDLSDIHHFISNFQKKDTLTIGELWAIPIMLRISIIEMMRTLSIDVIASKLDRDHAQYWFNQYLKVNEDKSQNTLKIVREMAKSEPNLTVDFVSEFSRCCQNQDSLLKLSLPLQWIEMKLREGGNSIAKCIQVQGQQIATQQVKITNLISSLRAIYKTDWQEFVESESALNQILKKDSSQIFSKMNFETRDNYRRIIESISKYYKISECIIAEELFKFSKEKHIGYYLFDNGLNEFLAFMNLKPSLYRKILSYLKKYSFLIYFSFTILLSTWLGLTLTKTILSDFKTSPISFLFIFSCLLILSSQFALSIIHSFSSRFKSPKYLPRMDYSEGVPENASTIVVIPTLLINPSNVQSLISDLEIRFLGNRDPSIYFALLSDFRDSNVELSSEDLKLVELAKSGILQLNEKYDPVHKSKFLLLHRPRRWNESEKKWMGYERKRGKLEEFGLLLEGKGQHLFSHIEGNLDFLSKIKYVLTLDTDTKLTPGTAHKLIGNLDHPLNHPEIDLNTRKTIGGYGLLQPRIGGNIPLGETSIYFDIFNAEPGINPYTKLVSDLYQDFFEEGSFIGKGIYDLKTFNTLMCKRFPENRILSHDLIEGCFVRSGLVSDVVLYEDHPQDFITDTFRNHRWTRGDWQIASWLFSNVPTFENQIEKNQLSGLSKWKIFDNLRRSIVSIAAVSYLIWSIFSTNNMRHSLLILVGILFMPYFVGALDQFIRTLIHSFTISFVSFSLLKVYRSLFQGVFYIIFLPIQAYQNLDAIIRTLYRLYISKNRLLEWTCYHTIKSAQTFRIMDYLKLFWYAPLLSLLLFAAIAVKDFSVTNVPWEYYTLFIIWGISPIIAWKISKPRIEFAKILNNDEKNYLMQLALQISNFFSKYEDQKNNWLPPDNFQETPIHRIANRTSPTNIGLSLVSALASHDLGFLKTSDLITKVTRQFNSLTKLERYKGHFLNWYDTVSLQPLEPRYISTVDSGNFVASLFVLKQGLIEIQKASNLENEKNQINTLLKQLNEFCNADFSFLYDKKVKLFSIGFNLNSQSLDQGYYDLLASESRLTSFLAIVKDQAPMEHWFTLGRSITVIKSKGALLSWSGSMFEYLMPNLFMPFFKNSLLEESCIAALKSQMDYGKILGIPWGMSESGYSATDQELNYQYRAFGVPELGFKRDLQHELVIAPYATALALLVNPKRGIDNLKHLEKEGFRGEFGFYEAIDYTSNRLRQDHKFNLVRSYMAHHQGMSLIAITNLLKNGIMIQRFLADPEFRAYEILLQENIPDVKPVKAIQFESEPISFETQDKKKISVRKFIQDEIYIPEAAVLSNGNYRVVFTNSGLSYSICDSTALTPWRGGIQTNNLNGFFFYISDLKLNKFWSNTHLPTQVNAKFSEVQFYDTKIEILRQDYNIDCKTTISISPVDSLELRTITLMNKSDETRNLKLTSYAEPVMASNSSFISHPSFSKLFIETKLHKQANGIICQRRRRSNKDPKVTLIHFFQCEENHMIKDVSYETDRMKFIGRNRSLANPISIETGFTNSLSNTFGATLDPVVSIQCEINIPPKQSCTFHFYLGISENSQQIETLISKYSELSTCNRVSHMAWTHGETICKHLGINEIENLLFNKLGGLIELPLHKSIETQPTFSELNSRNVSSIWKYGISGDRPIILVKVTSNKNTALIKEVIKAHSFLKFKGVSIDLIFLSTEEISYRHEISDYLASIVSTQVKMDTIDKPGGVFIRRIGNIQEEDRYLLSYLTSISLIDTEGSLENQLGKYKVEQIQPLAESLTLLPIVSKLRRKPKIYSSDFSGKPIDLIDSLQFYNQIGGFSKDGTEYQIHITKDHSTPLPWVNVIANPKLGTVISERGSSYTWYENAHEFRISPWYNDAILDKTGESIIIRDDNTSNTWSVFPYDLTHFNPYFVKHGFGYTEFQFQQFGIQSKIIVYVAKNLPIKFILIELQNNTLQTRNLTCSYSVDLVLGENQKHFTNSIITEYDSKSNTLIAKNPRNIDFSHCISFLKMVSHDFKFKCERSKLNPFEIQGKFTLSPQGKSQICFMLGAANSTHEFNSYIEKLNRISTAHRKLESVKQYWKVDLSKIQINTGDRSADTLTNGWLLYQIMSSRLYARSGFYQSGGAYGFRDQLQDSMALVYNRPDLLREQILRSASMQFVEGDVLHWWHPPSGRGVRTRITDDLLWLPYAVCRYVNISGDKALLDEQIGYIEGPEVPLNAESEFFIPTKSTLVESIYAHCVKAIFKSLHYGKHGLPLMGGGDWNDGMNEVGLHGHGESVWLAFFLHDVLSEFLPISKLKDDFLFSEKIKEEMQNLEKSIEQHAWDGDWYRRAYFDDGNPLGTINSPECQIDLLPQCWSVLSNVGSKERMHKAMQSVVQRLIDEKNGLIRLLDPPFDNKKYDPGYIKGYIPGTRENGAQYTHAAVWTVMAFVKLGLPDEAWKYFSLINPINHGLDWDSISTYKVEPFVVAADVYSQPPHSGRGGWTWYTGSAAWMYRLVVEYFIGLNLKENRWISFKPCLPKHINNVNLKYRFGQSIWDFQINRINPQGTDSKFEILIDSELYLNGLWIELKDDNKTHHVIINL